MLLLGGGMLNPPPRPSGPTGGRRGVVPINVHCSAEPLVMTVSIPLTMTVPPWLERRRPAVYVEPAGIDERQWVVVRIGIAVEAL